MNKSTLDKLTAALEAAGYQVKLLQEEYCNHYPTGEIILRIIPVDNTSGDCKMEALVVPPAKQGGTVDARYGVIHCYSARGRNHYGSGGYYCCVNEPRNGGCGSGTQG